MPSPGDERRTLRHLSHWGAFLAIVEGGRLVGVEPHPADPAPTPLIENFLDGIDHEARVRRPAIRKGWLDRGPGPDSQRGADDYVEVDWPEAIELLADELRRVIGVHGNASIYGGSYGWGSAGRFHHAQSQVHRFLNSIGGYTRSVNTYSSGASEVILPRVVGNAAALDLILLGTAWQAIVEHTDLVVAFGGMHVKNSTVASGGIVRHLVAPSLAEAGRRGVEFELFSPLRDDLPPEATATWHPLAPGTDTAVMLALAHVLVTERLHDQAFLDRFCTGGEQLIAYVLGRTDGVAKSPEWAEALSGIEAGTIR